ncbi:MAG: hypothetical protein ABIY55_14025 [Kofleriaceae bacterium]
MSESSENNADDSSRNGDLLAAIRAALVPDAPSEARTTAANACRAILRGLEPTPARNGAPAAAPASPFAGTPLAGTPLAGTPLGNALGVLGSLPREQVLQFLVTGMRALLGQGSPTYRAAPVSRIYDTTERAG